MIKSFLEKKLWIENFELKDFKANKYPDQVKDDFFYLLKKNNYDTLDESIFNKDSYTYDFSESEIKSTISEDSHLTDFSGRILETTTYYKFVNSDKTWYETKMKIKKNNLKTDFVDWNNKDELELKLYVYIERPVITTKDIGDFIIIDKDGNERRSLEKEIKKDFNTWDFNYNEWKEKEITVEELISWDHISGWNLPISIKRVPKKPSKSKTTYHFYFLMQAISTKIYPIEMFPM